MARNRTDSRKPNRSARNPKNREPYPYVLIVSEDSKSSLLYFKEIFQSFHAPTNTYSCKSSKGTAPKQVVSTAIKLCDNSDWEYVFCVFDRDDHRCYFEAIEQAKKQVLKNTLGKAIDFKAIPSNPCFELWLLLHFKEHNREDVRDHIVRELKTHIPDYEKGKKNIFSQTKADWKTAADRARRLPRRDDHSNPSTLVYELVEELHRLYP